MKKCEKDTLHQQFKEGCLCICPKMIVFNRILLQFENARLAFRNYWGCVYVNYSSRKENSSYKEVRSPGNRLSVRTSAGHSC